MASAATFARALTYAGAIPFVVATAALFFSTANHHALFSKLLITYAVVIASFLGGIQWGVAISAIETAPTSARNLLFVSVLPSLLAWIILFIPTSGAQFLAAATLFATVWAFDALLALQKLIPSWFFRLRCAISAIVIACLFIAYFSPA